MLQTTPFSRYAADYDAWYERHPLVYESELLALREQLLKLPANITGIEVGLGTGRFAARLGIKEGVEPVEEMAQWAEKRGIEVMRDRAEHLPYRDLHFDFVLFVTVCHLDNLKAAFAEAYRVLKRGGAVIVGFLEKDGAVAQSYLEKRAHSRFYGHATFYSADRLQTLLQEAGFKQFDFVQTLRDGLDLDEVESPQPGYGEGSFVVVLARK